MPGQQGCTVEPELVERSGSEILNEHDGIGDQPIEHGAPIRLRLRRRRSLADTVGPGMSLLVVGLNPSPYAADLLAAVRGRDRRELHDPNKQSPTAMPPRSSLKQYHEIISQKVSVMNEIFRRSERIHRILSGR